MYIRYYLYYLHANHRFRFYLLRLLVLLSKYPLLLSPVLKLLMILLPMLRTSCFPNHILLYFPLPQGWFRIYFFHRVQFLPLHLFVQLLLDILFRLFALRLEPVPELNRFFHNYICQYHHYLLYSHFRADRIVPSPMHILFRLPLMPYCASYLQLLVPHLLDIRFLTLRLLLVQATIYCLCYYFQVVLRHYVPMPILFRLSLMPYYEHIRRLFVLYLQGMNYHRLTLPVPVTYYLLTIHYQAVHMYLNPMSILFRHYEVPYYDRNRLKFL